jgi:hypothetical protein
MNYDIVATLGPSSNTPAIWQDMFSAGATAHSGENDHPFWLMPITQSDASRSPNPMDGDQLGRRPFRRGAQRRG